MGEFLKKYLIYLVPSLRELFHEKSEVICIIRKEIVCRHDAIHIYSSPDLANDTTIAKRSGSVYFIIRRLMCEVI